MPADPTSRQPGAAPAPAPSWFHASRALPLLQVAQRVVPAALRARPAAPWLWVTPIAPDAWPAALPPRGVRLYREGTGLAGDVRCTADLPFPSETFGNVVLQHALVDGDDPLLEEAARILQPGGRLWLFALNPWSPYRARWRGHGLAAVDARHWRRHLRAHGLQLAGTRLSYHGPVWRGTGEATTPAARLRAVYLFETEKRASGIVPPAPVTAPVRIQWQRGASAA